jgi:hypothetical protein
MHRDPALLDALCGAADLRQKGLAAYAEGRLQQARELFEAARQADPVDADILADLAAVVLESNDAGAAARFAARALALEPAHDAARLTLALARAQLGAIDDAVARLGALLADEPPLRNRDAGLAALAQAHLVRLGGGAAGPEWRVVDPRALGLKHRFDVVAKYLYCRSRLGRLPPWVNVDVRALYAKHIHIRTGGAEPGDESRKGSLADFLGQFDALIDDMARRGFDPAHPIPLSSEDGLPRNGAHRLAAALAVGCDVAVIRQDGAGGRWPYEWFRNCGFAAEELNVLLRGWAEIKAEHAGVVLLWSPVEAAWPQIEARVDDAMSVVAARTVDLPRPAFEELVRDIYSFDWGPQIGENIARKIGLLAAHAPRLRVLFTERPAGSPDDLPRALKSEIRDAWQHLSAVDRYTTVHVSESAMEARHLMAIFASENNMRWLGLRAERPTLDANLVEMARLARDRGVDPLNDCCVVGSSVLDALGLRAADDVDFTLRSTLRFEHFDGGVTRLGPKVDVVSFNYPRSFSTQAAATDDELIDDPSLHFRVRGIRFADPRVVLARKQHQRRDKDLRDVALLAQLLAGDSW